MKHPLKQVVEEGRAYWDRPGTRPAVRKEFSKLCLCGTVALGAEVYASPAGEKIVYHSCKSRCCPSCGFRGTLDWQEQQWAALPDTTYTGLVFTMPSSLWPIFRDDSRLQHLLPAVGAAVIKQFMMVTFNVDVMILIVPQTFNGKLEFNSHLHCMISGYGLRKSDCRWIGPLRFTLADRLKLTKLWQAAVVAFLGAHLSAGKLGALEGRTEIRKILRYEAGRKWTLVFIHERMSKKQFLGYAARYIRRPPIAQNRIIEAGSGLVTFSAWSKREGRSLTLTHSTRDFLHMLSQHVLDEYKHAIRYFGLLSPRSRSMNMAWIFSELGQRRQQAPTRLTRRKMIQRCFNSDPLLDSTGQPMSWTRRIKPRAEAATKIRRRQEGLFFVRSGGTECHGPNQSRE